MKQFHTKRHGGVKIILAGVLSSARHSYLSLTGRGDIHIAIFQSCLVLLPDISPLLFLCL